MMKYIIYVGCLVVGMGTALAQPVDLDRINREIEVAEQIIGDLIKEIPEEPTHLISPFLGRGIVEGNYIKDFGVIFTINPRFFKNQAVMGFSDKEDQLINGNFMIASTKISSDVHQPSLTNLEALKEVLESFAVEYAYLLRSLNRQSKVMINYTYPPNDQNTFIFSNRMGTSKLQNQSFVIMTLKVADVEALQKGEIELETFKKRLSFKIGLEEQTEESKELLVLQSIFRRLYSVDLSETFSITGSPTYEYLEGFGVIFKLKMQSHSEGNAQRAFLLNRFSGALDTVILRQPTVSKKKAKGTDPCEKWDRVYPSFLWALKQHIIEYGSTLNSLQEDESLIFEIQMPDCCECEVMAKKMIITASQQQLKAFKKHEQSLESIVTKLNTTEVH